MLARLVLTDVRNHAALTLAPGPGFVVLTGANGAGKTNILEAVSLLAPGRGLRRAALPDVQRIDGPGGFGIAATLDDATELATGTLSATPERRIVRINAAAVPAAALAERLIVLWLTPAMDRLFVEPPSERRAFLDRLTLALDTRHAGETTRYDAAMRARNRLLTEERPDRDWLTALERQMAAHGAAVDSARRETVALLSEYLAAQGNGDFPCADLALHGWSDTPDGFARSLADHRPRDAAAGRSLIGPHRADLIVTHVEKRRPAALASTGEQKALLLGIILAHADLVGERRALRPVLLLDEIAAHLDPARRAALFDRLAGRGQVWMTGTEAALFDGIGAEAVRVTIG